MKMCHLVLILVLALKLLCAFSSSVSSDSQDFKNSTKEICENESNITSAAALRMEYRHLGNSGLLVSRLSYGAWITFGEQVDEDKAYKIMRLCVDAGVNLFDNAEAYNGGLAETVMGKALQRLIREYPIPREHLVITTKIFFGTVRGHGKNLDRNRWVPNQQGLSRKHIIEGTRASLKRLQLEYVDVVYAHRFDKHTPMEEIVRAFNWLIEQGMAFYWCTSEWSSADIRHAMEVARRLGLVGPICEQPQYNMLHRSRFETEYLPLYRDYKFGTTIWSALSSGMLTGKYNNGIPPGSRLSLESASYILKAFQDGTRHKGMTFDDVVEVAQSIGAIASRLGCTTAQLAVAWVLKNDHVTSVILGATKLHQLEDTFGAMHVASELLDDIVMQEIEDVLDNKPEVRKDWNPNKSLKKKS